MAGIGFRLQKLLNSNNYSSLAAAYGYSAVVSSGPWMMSMASLVLIGFFLSADNALFPGDMAVAAQFRIVTTYAYAGSLLLGGLFHLSVSRYISDLLYGARMEEVLPCFMRTAGVLLIAGLVASGTWFFLSGLEPARATAAVLLFQSLSVTWLAMVFLSAAKGYELIAWGFFGCNALGVGLTLWGYGLLGPDGALWGYALGQFLLAAWLAFRIIREFPSYSPETNEPLRFLADNRHLVGVGFVFNLGIWVDKFILWYSPLSSKVFGLFHCAEVYDTCLFFSYLTVVPAMALFLIRVETSFYRAYSVYFNAVTCGGDLSAITEGKERIRANVWLSASRLAKSQGGLTLCLIFAAPLLAPYLGIGGVNVPTLRLALLAAFLQSLLLFMMIFFLYFDWQRHAMMLALLFVTANAAFTSVTVVVGREYQGMGYLFALLLSLLAGAYWFHAGMERLEFETFAKQVERR